MSGAPTRMRAGRAGSERWFDRLAGAWLAAVWLVVAACGPDPDDLPFVRTERCGESCASDVGEDAPIDGPSRDLGADLSDVPLEDWDTTGSGPLSGIFAVEVVVKLNVVIDVETTQLYRLRILQDGQEILQRTTLCAFSLPSVQGVAELEVPPALDEVVRTKSVEVAGPFLSAPDPIGAEYGPEPTVVVLGADLRDPEADPLPTAEDLSRQVDEDGDGNPGITVLAEAVVCDEQEALYAALRTQVAVSATIEDLDAFEGEVDPTLELSVLGYSHECMAAAARIPIRIAPGSSFRARRVGEEEDLDGNGNVSCDEIALAAPELFVQ